MKNYQKVNVPAGEEEYDKFCDRQLAELLSGTRA